MLLNSSFLRELILKPRQTREPAVMAVRTLCSPYFKAARPLSPLLAEDCDECHLLATAALDEQGQSQKIRDPNNFHSFDFHFLILKP